MGVIEGGISSHILVVLVNSNFDALVLEVCCTCTYRKWVRLLFGREFPMQDLLVLWDAIFADGIAFDLVDYIFVAMLLYIRDLRESRRFFLTFYMF